MPLKGMQSIPTVIVNVCRLTYYNVFSLKHVIIFNTNLQNVPRISTLCIDWLKILHFYQSPVLCALDMCGGLLFAFYSVDKRFLPLRACGG